MSTIEQLEGGKVVQPQPTPLSPPWPQQQQQKNQEQQFGPDHNLKRRLDGDDEGFRRIARTDLLSLSTRERRLLGVPSRPVSGRPSKLRQQNDTRSGFLLLVAAILTAPLWSVLHGLFLLAGVREKRSGFGIGSIGVRAVDCLPDGLQNVNVSNTMPFNNSRFACDNGEFNVFWEGVVNISSTIKIGMGTTVRIFGESAASMPSTDSTYSSHSPTTSTSSANSSSTDIDLELELEMLSGNLNLPQGLKSAAVGSVGLGGGNSSGDSFGPIFFVDGGELYLESLAIRRGYSASFSSNATLNGGGIYAINAIVSASSCEFEDNFAYYLGGAIRANLSRLTLKDTVFRGNRAGPVSSAGDEDAESAGGGIACENSDLYLEGCLFDDNYANKKGGGVHMGVGRVSVANSLFFNNLAGSDNVDSQEALGEGAALSFTECTRSFDNHSSCGVNDTTFIYNTAARKGGAVAVGSGDAPSYIEFHRCLVDNSTTGWPFEDDPQGEGGAFAMGNGTTLVLKDCVVKNNYCGKKGGAITLSSGTNWEDGLGATVIMRDSFFTGNVAGVKDAGVINVGEYATARIEGQGNNFTRNACGADGGVVSATDNTHIVVEGGLFQSNEAGENGGVFLVRGTLNITGGNFSENIASDNGGVVLTSDSGSVTLFDGDFEGNEAHDGGVVFVSEDAKLFVRGGIYSGNKADNGGGAFWVNGGGDLKITGGTFTSNEADFGGFMYVEGDVHTSCEGASVVNHNGVDGGAIYAVEGAVVDWACHLIGNDALSGPAIYAREDANVTVRGVNVSDNVIARGSVMFVVSSTLYTYQVNLTDSTGSADLSAVQSDSDSTYIAEETAFVGFDGETVVYSEGILFLDDCDFSQSSASALVYSGSSTTTVIRNTVLGDNNFEAVIKEASAASMLPVNASFINVALTCSDSGLPCSTGSPCLEGDLGVYCQCYVRNTSEAQTCLDGDPGGLSLRNMTDPPTTFYPNLLEGDLVLTLDASGGPATFSSPTSTLTSSSTATLLTTTSLLTSGGVVWNISAVFNDFISWTVFPSVGVLLPGETITVRVASLPSADFDGTDTAEFVAQALGAPDQEKEEQPSNSSSFNSSSSTLLQTGELDVEDYGKGRLEQEMEVTFYHCKSGNFWNFTSSDNEFLDCELCTGTEGGAEGLDCSDSGASTLKLPLESGYWRASLNTTVIRSCFNEDACIGGIATTSRDDYCETGYKGPYCGVCASGYGRGSANVCHKCTEEFKGVMYFILVVAFVLTVVVIVLLGIYLVGGRVAVSQTMYTTRESVRMLQRRSSSLFIRSEFSRNKDATGEGRRASGRAFLKAVSSRDRMISGGGSAIVSNPSITNTVVTASSYSSSAHVTTDEDISGQSIAGGGGGASFSNSGADDVKVANSAADPSVVGVLDSSSSLAGAADTSASGRALISASARVQHSSPELTPASASARASAVRATTPAPARVPVPASAPESTSVHEEAEDEGKEEEKTSAAIIGEFLGKLPLSKLKIVIVVWQISSAVRQAGLYLEEPIILLDLLLCVLVSSRGTMYETFLSIIGIFSFDLSWILSAACLTVGLNFYHELLIVTIGPLFLLSLLGITFYLGSRPLRSSRSGVSPEGISNKRINRDAVGLTSSGATVLSTTSIGIANPEHEAISANAIGRLGGSRSHRRYSNSISMNTKTNTNTDSNIVTDSEMRNIVPSDASTVESATSDKSRKSVEEEVGEDDDGPLTREGLLTRRRSVRRIWKDGPGDDADSEQTHLWSLFARHTTMTLIILYLVYSTVSTVVFQTFACEDLDDIGKSYLRADFSIECDTSEYNAYKIYAEIMICVYPLGIPLTFWCILARHRSRINPPMEKNHKDLRSEDHVLEKKIEKRTGDPTVAPTSFLWAAYYPDRYYFEVCECIRRLLLTGLLVFIPDTSGQVSFGCLFAFISLVVFELLHPHMDQLDRALYRTGCLVIFFTNFLALIITADVVDRDSKHLAAYAIGLIIVNIVFVILSILWNTWATTKAIFSERHVQSMAIGFDIIGEDEMDEMTTAMKAKETKGRGDAGEEVKREREDFEAAPVRDRDPSAAEEPIAVSRISSSRCYNAGGRGGHNSNSIAEFMLIPPSFMEIQAAGAVDDNLNASEPYRRQHPLRRQDTMSRAWTITPQYPSSTTPVADNIFDRDPRSRGFPYASRILPATPSAQNPPHATGTPA